MVDQQTDANEGLTAADIHRIYVSPEFQLLARRRRRLSWSLTSLTLTVYVAFFVLVALAPAPLGDRVPGFGSVGLLVVVALFLFAFAMTAVYLRVTTRRIVPEQQRLAAAIATVQSATSDGATR